MSTANIIHTLRKTFLTKYVVDTVRLSTVYSYKVQLSFEKLQNACNSTFLDLSPELPIITEITRVVVYAQ